MLSSSLAEALEIARDCLRVIPLNWIKMGQYSGLSESAARLKGERMTEGGRGGVGRSGERGGEEWGWREEEERAMGFKIQIAFDLIYMLMSIHT